MTKIYLSKFEKVAGLFVLGGISILVFTWISAALKQGWLEPKVYYYSKFPSGEGLYVGLDVLLSGLKVGQVYEVDLLESNEVLVKIGVIEKYKDKIRQNSRAMLIRPLVLGERAIELTLGDKAFPAINEGDTIETRATFDILTLLSGRMVNDSFSKIGGALENVAEVMTVILEKEKLEGFVRTIDRIEPLVKNLDQMSKEVTKLSIQMNKNENVGKIVRDLALVTKEVSRVLPHVVEKGPKVAENFEKLVDNMAVLSEQFKVIGPALAEIGPELPQATRKALQALDETLVLLKAMQKSFLLKSHVESVKEEDRKPSSSP